MQEIIEEEISPEKKDQIEEPLDKNIIDTLYPQPNKQNEFVNKIKSENNKNFILLKKIDEIPPDNTNQNKQLLND